MSDRTRKSLIGLAGAVIAVATISAHAAPISFAWDPSLSPEVTGYRLYAHTNGVTFDKPLVSVDAGTNCTATVDQLLPAKWTVWATAYTTVTNSDGSTYKLESDASEALTLIVPRPPEKMATVSVQWIGTLASTNWTDMGFFRLKIGTP